MVEENEAGGGRGGRLGVGVGRNAGIEGERGGGGGEEGESEERGEEEDGREGEHGVDD